MDEVEGTLASEGITIAFSKCMSEVRDSGLEITIVATTNKPWKLSSAMLRRFTAKIYVSLPEKKHVLKLLKNSLKRLEQRETPSGRQPFTLEKAVLGETLDKLTTEYFRKPQERYLTGDEVVQSVNTIGETLSEELLQSGARIFKKVGQ